MSGKEKDVMTMFRESEPSEDGLFEHSYVNHLAWSLLVVAIGLVLWLAIALVNAENQRNALMTKACVDPVFKNELDLKCLTLVRSREHWWQHLAYALVHLRP